VIALFMINYHLYYPEQYNWINAFAIDELVIPKLDTIVPIHKKQDFNGKLYLLTDAKNYSAPLLLLACFSSWNRARLLEKKPGESSVIMTTLVLVTPKTALSFYVASKPFSQYGGTNPYYGVVPH